MLLFVAKQEVSVAIRRRVLLQVRRFNPPPSVHAGLNAADTMWLPMKPPHDSTKPEMRNVLLLWELSQSLSD
jgi:hypothetical protein